MNALRYRDLSAWRLIGTGQFGSVRIVTHEPTKQVYALKVSQSLRHRL